MSFKVTKHKSNSILIKVGEKVWRSERKHKRDNDHDLRCDRNDLLQPEQTRSPIVQKITKRINGALGRALMQTHHFHSPLC